MSEDDLKRAVIDMAYLFGCVVAHFRPARMKGPDGQDRWVTPVEADGKGWPDLVIVGTRVLFRELKSATGPATPEQKAWIARLELAGLDVGVWRPKDLTSGLIERELRAICVRKYASITGRENSVRKSRPAWMK